MNGISTQDVWSSALLNLTNAEQSQITAQNQVSTGKTANDLSGYGGQSASLTAMQATQARLNGYISGSQLTSVQLTVQDTAFTQLGDAGASARQAITNAIASGSATGLMQTLGQMWGQAVEAMNTQNNGVYVFGGGRTDQAPVTATTFNSLTTAPSVASIFQNGPLKTSSQINADTTVQTGFLASDIGTSLASVFQAIGQYNASGAGPLTGPLTQAQTTFLQGELSQLDAANTTVTDYQAQNGSLQHQVTSNTTSQQAQVDSLTTLIGDQSNVDMATALSKLTQAQQSVQASAEVVAGLRTSSLLNYLPIQ
jgi:flagellar hook-associated protein 3 FlgL